MRKASLLAILSVVMLILTLAGQAFLSGASAIAQMDTKAVPQQVFLASESASIEIANLSCLELSALGSAVNKVLDEEMKLGNIRKIAAVRAQELAGDAENVGGLFSGFVGFFREILAGFGWIEVEPPEDVVTLSIESEATILAIGEVAGQCLKGFGPVGQLGAAIVSILTPLAEWGGKELATKDALGDIGYFRVTKLGVGTMDVIYDKRAEVAWVNIDLENLEDEWKESYGWQNEHIYMYVPFDKEPPNLKKTGGEFDYRVVLKGESVELSLLAVPFLSQRDGKWSSDKLGIQGPSIYSSGCALTSAAMVMAYYRVDTNPGRLNRLIEEGGYTEDYLLKWQVVAERCYTDQNDIEFVASLKGDWQVLKQELDEELAQGYPVIAWVKSSEASSHFIVFRGKAGDKYYFFDPADENVTDRIWPDGYHGKYELLGLRVYHGVFAPPPAPKQTLSHPWPMFGHDAQNTRCSPYGGSDSSSTKWIIEFGEPGLSGCLVSADGTIYLTRREVDTVTIIAVEPQGNWRKLTELSGKGWLEALGPSGTLYAMLWEENKGAILALNSKGAELWRRSLPLCPDEWTYSNNIAIGADETIYASCLDGENKVSSLTVFDPDGTERWSVSDAHSGLAVAKDGTVYMVMEEGEVCAYDGQGKKKWEYDGRTEWSGYYDRVNYSIAIGPDGTVFVLPNMLGVQDSSSCRLIALTPEGTKRWHADIHVDIRSEYESLCGPAIAPDGSLYILGSGVLFEISSDGKLEPFAEGEFCPTYPIVDADGMIYVSESTYTSGEQPRRTSQVIAFAPDGSEKWRTSPFDFDHIWLAAIGANGTIYAGGEYWVSGQGVFQPILAIGESSATAATQGKILILSYQSPVEQPAVRGLNSNLWAVDPDTGNKTSLPDRIYNTDKTITISLHDSCTAWSMDGGKVACLQGDASGVHGIFIINRENFAGAHIEFKPPVSSANYCSLSWSPDGTKLAFNSFWPDNALHMVDINSGQVNRILQDMEVYNFGWSPDSTKIVFSGKTKYGGSSLFTIDADGGNREDLGVSGGLPAWSPDGSRIAFIGYNDLSTDSLCVLNLDTHQVQELFTGIDVHLDNIVWSPDGTQIAFGTGKAVRVGTGANEIFGSVCLVNSDGSNLRTFVREDDIYTAIPWMAQLESLPEEVRNSMITQNELVAWISE